MVLASRGKLRTDSFRSLNLPRPLQVVSSREGEPQVVQFRSGSEGVGVARIRECWRVEDRWWTEQPVSRTYYELELEDGRIITLFHDALGDQWHEQRVGPVSGSSDWGL